MSCLCCENCGRVIDTDFDPDAYIEARDQWLCETCRENIDDPARHLNIAELVARAMAGEFDELREIEP